MLVRIVLLMCLAGCRFDASGVDFGDDPIRPVEPGAALPESVTPIERCADLPRGAESGVYVLAPDDGEPFAAYCNMRDAGGGWTLAIKADGRAPTFEYESAVWLTPEPLAADAPDLDDTEAKLASFSRMPLREVMVALTDLQTGGVRLVVMAAEASSLLELVSSPARVTGSRRDVWLNALPGSELQLECSQEGFNLANDWNRVRIGVVANNEEYECSSHDSRVGVGGGGCPTCTHCGTGPGMGGPAVGNNFKGCSALPAFAAVYIR